jgi:Lipocalin-like domain
MKKQFAFLIPAFTLVLFAISSCGKEDDPIVVKTKTELLAQGSWKFKSATASGSDASGYLTTCQKDNIYTFVAAGTGTTDEGLTKCNVVDPQTTSFTWIFTTNETVIQVSSAFFTNTSNNFTLISLTETELVVSTFYNPLLGPSILVTITFQH